MGVMVSESLLFDHGDIPTIGSVSQSVSQSLGMMQGGWISKNQIQCQHLRKVCFLVFYIAARFLVEHPHSFSGEAERRLCMVILGLCPSVVQRG